MSKTSKPLSVDLFAGAGGLSEGLRLAGYQTVVANDWDEWAAETYSDNHTKHGTIFVPGDITSAKVRKEILTATKGKEIDLVAGGPPCQAFSQVRNHDRETDDPRNSLYRHLLGIVRQLQPKVFVMENVVGMKNLAGGKVGGKILRDLGMNGSYNVAWSILDAADYGVPQTRRRVLIVGVRSDMGLDPRFPRRTGAAERFQLIRSLDRRSRPFYRMPEEQLAMGEMSVLDRLLDPDNLEFVTVQQAIGDLVGWKPAERLERKPSNEAFRYPGKATTAYQRIMRGSLTEVYNGDVPSIREDTTRRLAAIPQGGNFRDIPPELQGRYLNGTKWGPDIGRDELSRKHYYAYRKLHPDYFSWTLNTKTDCVYHYEALRALSVREFARLHSFPDSYTFLNGDRHSRYAQVGNAVPPLLGKAIGEALLPLIRPARYKASRQPSFRVAERTATV
ncbi:MAG: DNA cytosine methyltransferase [Myxococcales bacterium]|nr:DNA cytosine methyltransferase [Myxococcales bacterium]MCB9583556.1 DNA cytosine methyltransferase [Polyangiaceae bacterium]